MHEHGPTVVWLVYPHWGVSVTERGCPCVLLFQHGIALPLLPGPGVRADSSIQSRGELAQAEGNTQLGRKKPSDDGGANHVLMADLGERRGG